MNSVDLVLALLFSADRPVKPLELAVPLGLTEGQVEQALDALHDRLEAGGPLQLVRIAGGVQLATRPEYAAAVAAFIQPIRPKMSRSVLEVLAIIAYRQPVTLSEVDAIRGVQSDYSLRILVERGLVTDAGRASSPGRPILYKTTDEFLHQFGLEDISHLPELQSSLPFAVEGDVI